MMRRQTANGGKGSVALYDTGEEFTTITGGVLSADNAAVFSGSNIFGITSTYDSGLVSGGSTSREFIENTQLEGGYGFPLVLEDTFDDEIVATFGGGVNGALPSNGQTYAVQMSGDIQSVNLAGAVSVWQQGVYFDTASEPLDLLSSQFNLQNDGGRRQSDRRGAANDTNAINSFNENTFEVTAAPGKLILINNLIWRPIIESGDIT